MKRNTNSKLTNIVEGTKTIAKVATFYSAMLFLAWWPLPTGMNHAWNDRTEQTDTFYRVSRGGWWMGHTDFVRYKDGTTDMKLYHGFGHRVGESSFVQELDGDDKVDKIWTQGSELSMNRYKGTLLREFDYEDNKKRFDAADKRLLELRKKNPLPFDF